jgi:hypothetical protein
VSNRDNKAAAAEFRELVGMEFDEFTRQSPLKLLVALSKFAEPVDITVLQFADEAHPLFQQQREKLVRALRYAWQRKDAGTADRRREMTGVVRRLMEEGDGKAARCLRPGP